MFPGRQGAGTWLVDLVDLLEHSLARSLAGKPLAGFRATPSRRNPVLYGMVVYGIRFKNPLLHRQSTLRKRRLGENRVSGQTSRNPHPTRISARTNSPRDNTPLMDACQDMGST